MNEGLNLKSRSVDKEKALMEALFENAAKAIIFDLDNIHAQAHAGKPFHGPEHPRTVAKRAEKLATVFRLSNTQGALIRLAAAGHDLVLNSDPADPNNLFAKTIRRRGAEDGDKSHGAKGNEARSAQLVKDKMLEANAQAGKEIFTEKHIETVVEAIHATYPGVDLGPDSEGATFEDYRYYQIAIEQNPELGGLLAELKAEGIVKGPHFSQPHLEKALEGGKAVPREVLIVALSDLGAAGLTEKEEFFKEGNDEMRELYGNLRNPEVMRRLATGDEESDRIDREGAVKEFIKWLNSQTGFSMWQALRFEKIVHLLRKQNAMTPGEVWALRAQFKRFPDNIRTARDRAKTTKAQVEEIKSSKGEKEAFVFLAREMGYEIRKGEE